MWSKRTRSIATLVTVFAVSTTALGGDRRAYMVPQQFNRGPVQTFRHDDALNELQNQAAGSRGLRNSTAADTDNRLSRMEQGNSRSVVVRDLPNDRSGGVILAMAPQIAAAVLGMIKQFDESPNPQSGVDKANAIIAAVTPLLGNLIAQAGQNQGGNAPAEGNAAGATSIPNVPQPTVKLTKALLKLNAALEEYNAAVEEYNKDQENQKKLQDKLEETRKTIADKLKGTSPGAPATGTPATGTPATGTPATGAPATGAPATGT